MEYQNWCGGVFLKLLVMQTFYNWAPSYLFCVCLMSWKCVFLCKCNECGNNISIFPSGQQGNVFCAVCMWQGLRHQKILSEASPRKCCSHRPSGRRAQSVALGVLALLELDAHRHQGSIRDACSALLSHGSMGAGRTLVWKLLYNSWDLKVDKLFSTEALLYGYNCRHTGKV